MPFDFFTNKAKVLVHLFSDKLRFICVFYLNVYLNLKAYNYFNQ